MTIKLLIESAKSQSVFQQISVDAVVGIIGTLLGTVFGWFLNELSNRGKISVYLKSWNESFYANINDRMGGYKRVKENPDHFEYKMVLEIHNSSNTPKIIRDVKVVFKNGKKEISVGTPKDSTKLHASGPVHYYDEIGPCNIPANEIITMQLQGINRNIQLIRGADSVWFVFKDYKNRTQRRLIKKLNYAENLDNNVEEQENG